jgi:hypothetical protein
MIVFLIVFLSYGCKSDRSKSEHDHTTALCNDRLFVETYNIFNSGAFGGNRVSQYLTDSTNFRIYIGTFDNAEGGYSYNCNDDQVIVYRVEQGQSQSKIIDSISYSIADLKRKKILE